MRYYSLVLGTTAKMLEEKSKIKLKQYDWYNQIGAMNSYFYQTGKNGVVFVAYREEENAVLAAFCVDEQSLSFDEGYGFISEMLSADLGVRKIRSEPREITLIEFYECALEARRRNYFNGVMRWLELAKIEFYNEYCNSNRGTSGEVFAFEEKIISEKPRKSNAMFDESVVKELANIESHKNTSELGGNVVHYFISGKSPEVACDITEAVVQRLAAANRLSGRRMEIISEISPKLCNARGYLEEIIENNLGGVIVIDMTGDFGAESADFSMTCKYLEKLVKQYRNKCLFIFTYNSDAPGFAYELLSLVKSYVIPVTLKEGKGDRRSAVKYLKELIRNSEYAKYAAQAGEFFKLYPGEEFTQTEVLAAFEQFGLWSLNKNVLKAYDYDPLDTFSLDRDENGDSSYEKLKSLIGLAEVKEQIDNIIATDIVEKERKKRVGSAYESSTMHMIFSGNPGSAKTTVAKLFAGIAREKGILKSGAFVERGGMDLDGLGAVYKIRRAFKEAEGGVLFVDEAYSLRSDVAVTALIQEMENCRESVIVILAGYSERMQAFLELNEGLKSRVPYTINFPDYNTDELTEIFKLMMKDRGFEATDGAILKARGIFERACRMENFGNGRFARNLLNNAVNNQAVRLLSTGKSTEKLRKNELFRLREEDIEMLGEDFKSEEENRGNAQRELEDMIGLSSVKAILKKVIASFRLKKLCLEKGIRKGNPSLHMAFTGNPGTAKTTVARLFAEIMRDEKILPSGKFVEAGRADLVSDHVGGTARLVKQKFKEAQGGVLFIDEAYSLCDHYENGFGDEAISTLVQEMENHRDDVIVIFAGYSDKMKTFLDRNPGMSSRIAFHVDFEDYGIDELCEITTLLLAKKQMTITDEALARLREIYEKASADKGFGNGRFVRKMLEEAEMNLAERAAKLPEGKLTEALITTIELCDIPAPPEEKKSSERRQIGFRCA